jgi:hypothetical protein
MGIPERQDGKKDQPQYYTNKNHSHLWAVIPRISGQRFAPLHRQNAWTPPCDLPTAVLETMQE